ncbi:8939_t:CDS:2, partial [Diversispora eburnea]
ETNSEEDFDDINYNSEDDGSLFKYNKELFKINDRSETIQDEPKIILLETNTTLQKKIPYVIIDYLEEKI